MFKRFARVSGRAPAGAIGVLVVTLFAAGCGGSSLRRGSSGVSVVRDRRVATEVPRAFRGKTLTVATEATYAPMEFVASNGHTVVGLDPDLASALGRVLGVPVRVVNVGFDGIIPGLAGGRFDLGMAAFTDTKKRQRVVDFVTYFRAGTSFLVRSHDGPAIRSRLDLCGRSVAVEKGTTEQDDVMRIAPNCATAGRPAVNVLVFPDQNGANLALASARAEVVMLDSPVAAYEALKSHGQFRVAGPTYGTAPYGIAVPKGSGLSKPLLDGLRRLMADGTYSAILNRWGLRRGGIDDPAINAARS